MKKIFLALTISLSAFAATAQSYDDIKKLLLLQKAEQAKTDFDKAFTNAKFAAKPEAYILKATVYSSVASNLVSVATNLLNVKIGDSKDDVIKKLGNPKNSTKTTTADGTTEMLFYDNYVVNTNENGKVDWISDSGKTGTKGSNELINKADKLINEASILLNDASAAFFKYKEMDPSMKPSEDPVYQNTPVTIYSAFYSAGYNDYNTNKWQAGFEKLKKAVQYSDFLIEKKMITATMDTNVLILAGVTAEKSENKNEAAQYYGRLADAKVGGDGFESIYRFLVGHYFGKKDMPAFEKYKALGEQLYPKSEYFKYDKIDFAVGLVENFNDKVKSLDEALATDPNNYKANQILGEIIYDTLNSSVEGAVLPVNATELEAKMVQAFNKSATAKPGFENPYLYLGDHFINKAVKIGEQKDAHAKEMKARLKPGTKPAADDVAKKDLLEKQYGDAMEAARDPYEKAAAILAAKPSGVDKNQDMRNKQQYKKVSSYLADIFSYKKVQAKANPKDMAKYEAEEKKWNLVYDSIK